MSSSLPIINVGQPALYAKQRAALFDPARYTVIEASTKAGKTVGAIVWQSTQVLADTRGRNHWWCAPIYGQAEIAYTRTSRMYGRLPGVVPNRSELSLTFPNRAKWWFKSAEKPDHLYGEDVADAVFDEFTRAREESWYALRSTITATGGSVRFIGNVRGRGWGWKLARRAETGEPNHAYHRITADDAVAAGVFPASELEDARRTLPHHVFRELYYCEPSDNAANPFGYEAIKACIAPMSDLPAVCYGVDLARSQDWTVIVGLDERGTVCRLERWQGLPWADTIARLVRIIGNTPCVLDSTGIGDVVLDAIQAKTGNTTGFKFTAESKSGLMTALAAAITGREIAYPEGVITTELEAFEYQYTATRTLYSAPEGMHDDAVYALALAWWSRSTMPAPSAIFAAPRARVDDLW